MEIGNGTGASSGGAVYQTAGAVTLYDQTVAGGTSSPDKTFVLGGTGSTGLPGYGYYFTSGGSLSAPFMDIGGRTSGVVGVMDVEGGTITSMGEINLNRGNAAGVAGYATLNVLGGSVNFDTFGVNPLVSTYTLMQTGYIAGSVTQITVGGGSGTAAINGGSNNGSSGGTASGIDLGQGSGATGAEDVLNLNTNGIVTVGRIFQTSNVPNGFLNFNGGTLRATPNNSGGTFMNTSSNVKYVTVFSGGGTIDNNGTNIAIGTPLLAASGSGVTGVSLTSAGAGYIGAPAVVFFRRRWTGRNWICRHQQRGRIDQHRGLQPRDGLHQRTSGHPVRRWIFDPRNARNTGDRTQCDNRWNLFHRDRHYQPDRRQHLWRTHHPQCRVQPFSHRFAEQHFERQPCKRGNAWGGMAPSGELLFIPPAPSWVERHLPRQRLAALPSPGRSLLMVVRF